MNELADITPAHIRTVRSEKDNMRDRDIAEFLGISEARLVAAFVGVDATLIDANPDKLMPLVCGLGEVMSLTRNQSCVIEKVGIYDNYHSGRHASMILTEAIDLRIFPKYWVTAFAIERETKNGLRRSLQIFDATGDAVHKIYLRDASPLVCWNKLVTDLATDSQEQSLDCELRKPAEAAIGDPAKAEILRTEWAQMTDTHQFMRLTSKLKMNRLGAYRMAVEPLVRALEADAINVMLEAVRDQETEVMVLSAAQDVSKYTVVQSRH